MGAKYAVDTQTNKYSEECTLNRKDNTTVLNRIKTLFLS